jgi:hypothetical protein
VDGAFGVVPCFPITRIATSCHWQGGFTFSGFANAVDFFAGGPPFGGFPPYYRLIVSGIFGSPPDDLYTLQSFTCGPPYVAVFTDGRYEGIYPPVVMTITSTPCPGSSSASGGGGGGPQTYCCPGGLSTTLHLVYDADGGPTSYLNGTYPITALGSPPFVVWQFNGEVAGHFLQLQINCEQDTVSGQFVWHVSVVIDNSSYYDAIQSSYDCTPSITWGPADTGGGTTLTIHVGP